MFCQSKNNTHLCNAQHFDIGEKARYNFAAGIFYAHSLSYSSVPCGALMRPQPISGVEQRGAELFFVPFI
nr:MAG TPA: hypothetical protein [Caudoviricetes sp.]